MLPQSIQLEAKELYQLFDPEGKWRLSDSEIKVLEVRMLRLERDIWTFQAEHPDLFQPEQVEFAISKLKEK